LVETPLDDMSASVVPVTNLMQHPPEEWSDTPYFLDDNVLIIVFEWAAGGDLKRLLRRHLREGALIEEPAVWRHFHQVVDAVAYMHSVRVMHRDVKPANVLVTSHGLKVADLGLGGAPKP
jgi:serine/threonine protein kinase